MRRFRYPSCLLVAIAALIALNAAIAALGQRTQRGQLMAAISGSAGADSLMLGNSLMVGGFDGEAFRAGGGAPAVSLALGMTTSVEHCLIARRALERRTAPATVVYGWFDTQLTERPTGRWGDLTGNRAIAYRWPGEAAAIFFPGSAWERVRLRAIAAVPMLAERSTVWSKVELGRRALSEIGMPRAATNQFGRVADFTGLEAGSVAEFTGRCDRTMSADDGLSPAVIDLLDRCRAAGCPVVLVDMPMPDDHRARFYATASWKAYRSYVLDRAREHGARSIDASTWVPAEDAFSDKMHLNARGAAIFSRRLGEALRAGGG